MPGETVDMDKLIAAVTRRVNPGGQKEVTIRKYGAEEIEIIVPEVNEVEVRADRADHQHHGQSRIPHPGQPAERQGTDRAGLGRSRRSSGFSIAKATCWPGGCRSRRAKNTVSPVTARSPAARGRSASAKSPEILVEKDIYNVTGAYLTRAEGGTDRKGQPCVNFMFNDAGGQLFGELTGSHLPDTSSGFTYKLGIVLDGQLYSAPSIQSTITNRGEITGSFTRQRSAGPGERVERRQPAAALSKEPIEKLYSGATLGNDTIEKSKRR